MARLEVSDIVWGTAGRIILQGISLLVPNGAFVGLVGPNGSGKSSLLRCVYRLHRPLRGVVRLDGSDIWRCPPRYAAERIAAVLQEAPLSLGLTVREIVQLGRTPHQGAFAAETAHDRSVVEAAVALVGLVDLAARRFDELSGGERQRTLLARAIAQEPQLLILDEPTNHLDIRYQRDVLRLARRLGVSVLASLHDLNQAAAYCDHLYVLADGRVVADGRPAEVLTPALIEAVFQVAARVAPHPLTGHPSVFYEP
jgi:iron complex transport system ATP-binding protein